MSINTRRGVVLAAVLSLAVLVPGSFRMAVAQPPAAPPPVTAPPAAEAPAPTAPGGKRTPRAMPLAEALKTLDLTADQKSKIKEIRAQTRKDLSAIPDRRSPEGMAKAREINKKQTDDVKASLPADLQAKFQTAFDAASAKNAEQNKATGLTAGLTEFKRPLVSLNLTPDEQKKVDPIAKDSYDKIVAVRQDTTLKGKARNAKLEVIVADMKTQVRPLLTPAQQTQLDALDLTPKAARGGRRGQGGKGKGPAEAAGAGTTTPPVAPAP